MGAVKDREQVRQRPILVGACHHARECPRSHLSLNLNPEVSAEALLLQQCVVSALAYGKLGKVERLPPSSRASPDGHCLIEVSK